MWVPKKSMLGGVSKSVEGKKSMLRKLQPDIIIQQNLRRGHFSPTFLLFCCRYHKKSRELRNRKRKKKLRKREKRKKNRKERFSSLPFSHVSIVEIDIT